MATHEPHPLYLIAQIAIAKRQRFLCAETLAGAKVYGPSQGGVIDYAPAGIVISDPSHTTVTAWVALASVTWSEPGSDLSAGQPPAVYPLHYVDGERWITKGEAALVGFYPSPQSIGLVYDSPHAAAQALATATAAAHERLRAVLG